MAEPIGQTFAGYEILAKIGQGGMGTVYKARQPMLNRIVAIKFMWPHLNSDEAFVARFIREAATAANLRHPNLVLVHTAGEHEGAYHIVMEFVEGKSLQEHIASQGRLDPREAVAITVYVCQALQYAWKKAQIIHRDIKPANIFLSTGGEVKLGDLGLAKSLGQSSAGATLTGVAMGSPHYMSPEQARALKEIDFRSDIYSLGCTLYHMLTGQPPYEGDDSLGIMMKQVNDPLPAIFKVWPQCPPSLARLVHRMLAKQAHQRHPSYEELLAELMAVHDKLKADAEKLPVESTQVVPAEPRPRVSPPQPEAVAATAAPVPKRQRSPAVLSSAAGLLGLALLGGLLWWAPWKDRAPRSPAGATKDHPWAVAPLTNAPAATVAAALAPYPPGQWVRAMPALSEVKDFLEIKDGWAQLHGQTWFPIADPLSKQFLVLRNGGIRVRRQAPPNWSGAVVLEIYGPAKNGRRVIELHYSRPSHELTIRDFRAALVPPKATWQQEEAAHVEIAKKNIPPLGVEFTAELIVVGKTVVGRIDGQTITGTVDEAASRNCLQVARVNEVPFRDVEVLYLDGLSEAEALKAAGITAAHSDESAWTNAIDLLALIDPEKDGIKVTSGASLSKANAWERRGSALVYVSDGGSGKVVAPVGIHAGSYEIELEFERLSGPARLHADLVLDTGRILPIYIQGTGYRVLGGSAGEKCPEADGGCAVVRLERGAKGGPDRLTIWFNNALLMDWAGDIAKVAMKGEPYPQFADQLRPSIYIHNATYKITAWKLRIFDGEARVLRSAGP